MIGCRPPRPAPRAIDRHCSGLCQKRRGNAPRPCAFPPGGKHFAPCARPCGNTRRLRSNAAARNICAPPPRKTYARKAGKAARRTDGAAGDIHSSLKFLCSFPNSIQLYEALFRYSFKCAIKGASGILPCLHEGTFSYFTAPSINLYIGPPSYFVSFRKSDLYIPVPPFARLPSRARLSMLDFGPLRTPSV